MISNLKSTSRIKCIWGPNRQEQILSFQQLQMLEDSEELQRNVKLLQDQNKLLQQQISRLQNDIQQIQNMEKECKNDVDILKNTTHTLSKSLKLKKTVMDDLMVANMIEHCKAEKDCLTTKLEEHLENEVQKLKKEVVVDISLVLGHKLDQGQKSLESNLISKIEARAKDVSQKFSQQFEELLKEYKEETISYINKKCISELEKLDLKLNTFLAKVTLDTMNFKREFDEKVMDLHKSLNPTKNEQQNGSLQSKECETEDTLRNTPQWKDEKLANFQLLKTNFHDFYLEMQRTEYHWKISGIQQLLKRWSLDGKGMIVSDPFIIKECGLPMQARLGYGNDSWVSLFVGFVQDHDSLPSYQPIFYHRRTLILLDQRASGKDKKNIHRINEPRFGQKEPREWMARSEGWFAFAPSAVFKKGTPYVVNDSVLIQIFVEPLTVLWKCFVSDDGTLLWKLDNYSSKKQYSSVRVIEYLNSDYFYSSPGGYRMRIRLGLDYFGKVGIWLEFKCGEWDASLSETFPHKTTLMILDQSDLPEKKDIVVVEEGLKVGDDFLGCFSYSELETPQYLKDDALLLKFIVEPKC